MQNFLCVNTYTSNCTIVDMRWTDVSITIKMNMLKMRNQIIQLSNTRFINTIFNVDFIECRRKMDI